MDQINRAGTAPIIPLNVTGDIKDANFPVDNEGRVYHLVLKRGQLANRLICVGDVQRALLLSSMLDKILFTTSSTRGFTTYTGIYKNKPVSIMAIGMGLPMMDFMVREARFITDGPMCVIRLGTCGTPRVDIPVGSIIVAKESACVTTNYDAFHHEESNGGKSLSYYRASKVIKADEKISNILLQKLKETVKGSQIVTATDVTADSFYSSQGRVDPNFEDKNHSLIDELLELYPSIGCLQMETFHLYHLALLSKVPIYVSACAIVLAQRRSNDFLDTNRKHLLEKEAGLACLETLINWEVDESTLMNTDECIWKNEKS